MKKINTHQSVRKDFNKLFDISNVESVFDVLGIDIQDVLKNEKIEKPNIVNRNNEQFEITQEGIKSIIEGLKGL
jgi:hypothetical protein